MTTIPRVARLKIALRVVIPLLVVAGLAGAQLLTGQSAAASGSLTGFENFALGDLNGQAGWTSGHASSDCPVYDVAVVPNTYGYPSFGAQSLRISNAITCGSFNDQTFSPSLTDEAGETTASTSTYSGGTRQPYFEAQWDFASTVPGSEQPGLSVVASADRGDPSRMSWLQMQDTPAGLQLNFLDDNRLTTPALVVTPIASGLDRTVPHTVRTTIEFLDGPSNDVVKVYLDGALIHTGTTWEDYFRDLPVGTPPAPVDSMLFHVRGTAAPLTSGKGFLIDNFSSYSGPGVPSADLAGLSLSSGTLAPPFDPATTAYSASVDNATTSVAVSATTNPGATAVLSGGSSLAVGGNTVTITVTAANGVTTKTYTVMVNRAAAPPPAATPAPLGAPQDLVGSVQGNGELVLYWKPPAGSPAVAHYVVWKDGKVLGVTGGASYQLIVSGTAIGDTSIFQVSAKDGDGNASPMSTKVTGVPDLAGLSADQARALVVSRGFTVGTVTTKLSNAATNTVIGQNPWPLPAYRPLGTAVDIVVSLHATASTPLLIAVSASRRVPIAIRHSFTPRIVTSIAATASISLTKLKNIHTTYAKWTRPLHAGTNYLTLRIPAHLKIKLPGIYRLTIRVQAGGQSKLYSVPMQLASRVFRVPLPRRDADVLLITSPSISAQIIRQLSTRYRVKTADTETVFTKTAAPNERVGAVIIDADTAGLSTIRHLHTVFPDLHIIALVSTPSTDKLAKAVGASTTLAKPTSSAQLAARLTQALEKTLGK